MAHSAKPLSFLFLILISTSLHVEARERLFFNKATHTTNRNAIISESPESAPSLSPAPAPATEVIKPSETGYGLYSQKSDEFLPTKTTTAVFPAEGGEIQDEELSENYEKEETGYTYNNNNNNGYLNNQNSYNANGYANNYNGGSGYVSEGQGMSDTRFMENGKFYYNSKSENSNYSGSGKSTEGYDNGNGENEFDSMEEYERQQGYYPQSQGEYVP